MGLRVWSVLADLFDHTQARTNLDKLDAHDHTTGKGVPIPSGGIANGAITTTQLANNSVTTDKIVDGTIAAADLGDGSVTIPKFGADALAKLPGSAAFRAQMDGASPGRNVPAATNYTMKPVRIFDSDSWYDSSTGRYTPQIPGIYVLVIEARWESTAGYNQYDYCESRINKNTLAVAYSRAGVLPWQAPAAGGVTPMLTATAVVDANGTSDYFTWVNYHNANSPFTRPSSDNLPCTGTFSGFLLRATGF